ncbi:hypothetical protein ACFY2V_28075 [Streptomyces eurythermus]|uniref:hypothetical protein n=1 Tax=Streptomyces eurythermus TaxID=42237 RepID=UPI0036AA92A3
MNHDPGPEAVTVGHTTRAVGRHFEELLAAVYAWTELPFGETYHAGEDDSDYSPVCDCAAVPPAFCMSCVTRAVCRPCM